MPWDRRTVTNDRDGLIAAREIATWRGRVGLAEPERERNIEDAIRTR